MTDDEYDALAFSAILFLLCLFLALIAQ